MWVCFLLRQVVHCKTELTPAKRQLFTNRLSHATLERQLVQAESARIETERKLRDKELVVERLERDRRYYAEREEEARLGREQDDAEHEAVRGRLTAQVAALRSSLAVLQETHADLENAHSRLCLASSHAQDTHHATAAALERRNQILQSSLEQAQSLAADRLAHIHHLQDQLEQPPPHQPPPPHEHDIIAAELERQTQHLRQLESDNTALSAQLVSLRSTHQATEVLREQIHSLEAKVAYTDSLRQQLAQLQASPPSPPPPPPIVPDNEALSSLRLQHTSLLDEHGSTLASFHALQNQHTQLQSQLASAQSHLGDLTYQLNHEKDARQKQDAQAVFFQSEIKFLKDLVASYQAEEPDANPTIHRLLDDYKSLSTSNPQYQSLLDRIDQLEQQLLDLQGEIAAGRHVPPNTRVLQLADNPEKQWFDLRQQTMDELRQENKALFDRLMDRPHEPSSSSSSLIPPQSYTSLQSSLSDLQSQLAQKEKRLLRLDQIFRSKAIEFREAVEAILGVKLAFYTDGQVRVTSVFDSHASFVFQPGATPTQMQLVALGQGGPQDLPNLMGYWIENEQCPPGFIASVTLECYEKSKARGVDSLGSDNK